MAPMPLRTIPPAERRRFVRFLLVGMVNTAFGYGVFAVLLLAGLPSALALLLATVIGVVFNFFTTGRMVFESNDRRRLPRFVLAYVVTYSANLALLKLLEAGGVPSLAAQ